MWQILLHLMTNLLNMTLINLDRFILNHIHIWIPRNLSFGYISFHAKRLQTMLRHHNARVNSHQRWKQTRFRVCFHLWCELTSTMNVTQWQVSWHSWAAASTHQQGMGWCEMKKMKANHIFCAASHLLCCITSFGVAHLPPLAFSSQFTATSTISRENLQRESQRISSKTVRSRTLLTYNTHIENLTATLTLEQFWTNAITNEPVRNHWATMR